MGRTVGCMSFAVVGSYFGLVAGLVEGRSWSLGLGLVAMGWGSLTVGRG